MRVVTAAVVVSGWVLVGCGARAPEASPEVRSSGAGRVEERGEGLGHLVRFHVRPSALSESLRWTWLAPERRGEAEAAAVEALAAYPQHVVRRAVRGIVLLETLEIEGSAPISGTYEEEGVIYAVYKEGYHASTRYLLGVPVHLRLGEDASRKVQRTIHHELSSLLLAQNEALFPHAAWAAANPEGFEYNRGLIGEGDTGWDQALAMEGFLCRYSQSSLENDFNMIAAELFMGDPAFWAWVDASPALASKVGLAIGFYRAIDGLFTEEGFRARVRKREGR